MVINLGDPLLQVAAANRRSVTDFDFRVLTLAVPHLSALEPRALKLDVIATLIHVDRSNVGRALKRLVLAGFLVRVDRDAYGTWRYRLPRSPGG